MGKVLIVEVNNQGTVGVYMRGHGKDIPYVTTLVRPAYIVPKGMAIDLRARKIKRWPDRGNCLADALSKGEVSVLQKEWPSSRSLVELPWSIINWVKD